MAKRVFEEAKARTAGFVRRLDSDEDDEDEDGAGLSGDTGAAAKRRKVTAATDPAAIPSAARAAATARPTPTFAVKPKARVVVEPAPHTRTRAVRIGLEARAGSRSWGITARRAKRNRRGDAAIDASPALEYQVYYFYTFPRRMALLRARAGWPLSGWLSSGPPLLPLPR